MNRKNKNFHYHYAEKYQTKKERLMHSRKKAKFAVSPLAVVVSLVFLIVFGLISTTFSVYVTSSFDDPSMPEEGGLVVSVRNDTIRSNLNSSGVNSKSVALTGANSDFAETGYDTVQIHTEADVSGEWVSTTLSTSDGNHYTGSIYFMGSSSNYGTGMKVAGVWKVFGGYWLKSGTAYNDAWNAGGTDDDQIVPITATTTTYIKGSVDFYKEYSNKPFLKITQTQLSALSTTVTVGSTTLTSEDTTTIGNTSSGGSGSYTHSYQVHQGSASGTDVTTATLGSSTGTTFTAPSVTSATTYYITHTLTDSNTGATKTSAAKTITVNPKTNCEISLSSSSKTLTVGGTTTVTVSAINHASGNITVTSGDGSYVQVSNSSSGTYGSSCSISGVTSSTTKTLYIKGIKPTSSAITLTASCAASHSNSVSATMTVTVSAPTLTFNSCSVEEYKTGTLSVDSSSPTPSSYSWSTASSAITLGSSTTSSVEITAAGYSTNSATVTLTVTYSTGYTTSFDADVTLTESDYYLPGFDNWSTSNSDRKMVYNSATGLYEVTLAMTAGDYPGGSDESGFKILKNVSSSDQTWYTYTAAEITRDNCTNIDFSTTGGTDNNASILCDVDGNYKFAFNVDSKKLTVSYPSAVTVTFYSSGEVYTTMKVITGSTTSAPGDPVRDGYTFNGWSTDDTSANIINFDTYTFSVDTTLYAIWTPNVYNISYENLQGCTINDPVTTYTYGVGATLPTDVTRTDYIFGGWYENSDYSGSAVTSISTTSIGDKTFHAKWNVEVTFKDNIDGSIIDTQVIEEGGDATEPDLTSITEGLSDRGYELNESDKWSSDLTNITEKCTIYAIYRPVAQNFTISITPNEYVTGSGTNASPYDITFGSEISVHAEVTNPLETSNISYVWSTEVNGTYTGSTTGTTYDNKDITTMFTVPNNNNETGVFTLYAKAKATGVNSEELWSATISQYVIYYKIDSPLSANTPAQKIYNEGSAPDLTASITTHSSISDDNQTLLSTYKTTLWHYDKSTNTYVEFPDIMSTITGTKPNFISTITSTTYGEADSSAIKGVNYFKFSLKYPESSGSSSYIQDSISSSIRTVVGTAENVATRPLYFTTIASNSFTENRVMLFYINSQGSLAYQTALNFSHGGSETYRFNIPESVNSVCIAVFDKSKEYVLPTLSNGTVDFTNTGYISKSEFTEIDSSVQNLTLTGVSEKVISLTASNLL